ncbi:MAG: phosphoglucosamine mutase [Phycisphaeraceae bacterium]|nr:phosphoglucosamine mutase [Phycisphaeraceae bacterium]
MTSPLMLSISGLRGIIGGSLTATVASEYGAAVGGWFRRATEPNHRRTLVVGRDSRPSGAMVEQSVVGGLLATGCDVVSLGIASTPAVAAMVKHRSAAGGLIITASHNPVEWNGIKVLRGDGVAPPPDEAAQIIERFGQKQFAWQPVEAVGALCRDDSAGEVHARMVLEHLDREAIARAGLTVVLDSVCGAGGPETLHFLEQLGVKVVPLNTDPTGHFPHPPEPTGDHLHALAAAVPRHHAHVGFAQDPDADRLALVDERGRYIGEEYTLVLAAWQLLRKAAHARDWVMAANLSTSRMLDDLAERFGCQLLRSPVGEANVAKRLMEPPGAEGRIGGEGNGGVIYPPVSLVRDSLTGIGLVLELLAETGRSLSNLVAELPAYAMVKDKCPVEPTMLKSMKDRLVEVFDGAGIDEQDGVRLQWSDRWLHVRASNTEPIVRLIAEARDAGEAHGLINRARSVLGA